MTFNTLNQQGETCEAPTNVAATNIGQTTADISWTQPGNSASSWDIQYKENGASGWNTVATSSNPHTLTGLTPETTYLLQVIAHCSNGQNSEPSTIATSPLTIIIITLSQSKFSQLPNWVEPTPSTPSRSKPRASMPPAVTGTST